MGEVYSLNKNSQYNSQVNTTFLRVARFIPFAMLAYGLFIQFGIVAGSELYSWQAFAVLIVALFVTGLTQPEDYGQSPLRQFAYYLIFLSFAVFVTGIQSILLIWAPLSVTTVMNFGSRSYWWSTLLLLSFILLDSFLRWPLHGARGFVEDLTLFITVTITAGIVVAIALAQMVDHTSLIRTKRRESLQYNRMQVLINSLSDAILSINSKGYVKLYNSAALDLLDTNKSLSGHRLDDIFKLYGQNGRRVSLFDLIDGENRTFSREDLVHRFSDGERIRLGITGAPIHSSFGKSKRAREGYIFIVRDITKSKSLEEERDEFISVISHELRTPITITEASISNMQLLAQRQEAHSDIVKGLGEAHEQVVYLAKMINDLSALSRAERSGDLATEEVNIDEMMQSLYKEYIPEARTAHLLIDLDVADKLGVIKTNRLYLEEILQNFITNALKYTDKGSITLHASRTPQGFLFAVKDTGPGIAKTERDKVFQKFYRSEDYRTRETGGTGLGLYVAEKLAAKLGTTIELSSRLHHGSTFSFVLPYKKQ